ncbi:MULTISPECIES: hypothetical protein [unclassified Streptomyces]|uniref:hypothetical protein n=1 Tax=unclassified Streptomyces TaxID=2593676 RepID=UPI0034038AF8
MVDQPKALEQRVTQLEASFQTFTTKVERGGAKAESVGAAASATGASASVTGASLSAGLVSAEANLVTSGVKLANFEFDLRQQLENARLKLDRKDPDGLDGQIKNLRNEYEQYVRRIHPVIIRLNTELPATKRETARAHRRIDGLRGEARESRERLESERLAIRRLRAESLSVSPTLSGLSGAVRTLATIIGG